MVDYVDTDEGGNLARSDTASDYLRRDFTKTLSAWIAGSRSAMAISVSATASGCEK
jgi:hypothetical protein